MSKILLFFTVFLLLNCQDQKQDPKEWVEKKVVIQLQPFADMKEKDVKILSSQIRKVYPHVEVLKAIDFPENAYYQPRNRYRADSVIKFLSSQTKSGYVKIGLTSKDISVTKGKSRDFGIMGLGYKPGKACIASSFRLDPKNKNLQFYKIAVHELVHTQGLNHCPEKSCLMRDADGRNHTNQLQDFCVKCKSHLKSKRWKFS